MLYLVMERQLVCRKKRRYAKSTTWAEGIPDSGSIDYSFFSEQAGIGMTDNEFNVVKLDAMQSEIANLIKKIDGVQDASVMITQA